VPKLAGLHDCQRLGGASSIPARALRLRRPALLRQRGGLPLCALEAVAREKAPVEWFVSTRAIGGRSTIPPQKIAVTCCRISTRSSRPRHAFGCAGGSRILQPTPSCRHLELVGAAWFFPTLPAGRGLLLGPRVGLILNSDGIASTYGPEEVQRAGIPAKQPPGGDQEGPAIGWMTRSQARQQR